MAMMLDANNYDNRKVAEKEQVGKFKISSCYTSDMGYETAIGYNDEFYPVERYDNKEECIKGHNKWIEWAKNKPKIIPYLQFDNETIENIDIEEVE
jgi:hypothetical protein